MYKRALVILMAVGATTAPVHLLADVYKYVDRSGNVVFSDKPLKNAGLELEWKRSGQMLVAENQLQSAQLRERQRAAAARLQAKLSLNNHQWLGRSPLWSSSGAAGAVRRPDSLAEPLARLPTSPLGGPKSNASLKQRRAHYQRLIDSTARAHQLWPELLHAVIRAESAYRADALSSAGACGLMQLMPATAERFKVRDIWDPAENLRGGARYLRFLLDLFDSDLRLALAGYNAGENAVKRHGHNIPPYPETQDYVRKVLKFLHAERQALRS
jgi:soluble lytic murein transglycosylase-like protein